MGHIACDCRIIVNDELERMRKGAAMAYCNIPSQNLSEGTEENKKSQAGFKGICCNF
jgi:hypothetical protein